MSLNAHFNVEKIAAGNNVKINVFVEVFDGVTWTPKVNSNRPISIDNNETKPIDMFVPINITDLTHKVRLSGNVEDTSIVLSFDGTTIPVTPSVSVSIIKI